MTAQPSCTTMAARREYEDLSCYATAGYTVRWTATGNDKTGKTPTMYVGKNRTEARASCSAVFCPLRPKADGGNGKCYSQGGTTAMAVASMDRAEDNGKDYSMRAAMDGRSVSAKAVRMTAIGDVASTPGLVAYAVAAAGIAKRAGLAVIGYTHGHGLPHAAPLRGLLMASAGSLAEADRLASEGWRVAVVLPATAPGEKPARTTLTPEGRTVLTCPVLVRPDADLTCNACRLCDASRPGPMIGFPDHGPAVATPGRIAARLRAASKRAASKA